MRKLFYICPWEKNKKESWSGTHYALYTALSKYFCLVDIDTSLHRSVSGEKKIVFFLEMIAKFLFPRYVNGTIRRKYYDGKIGKKLISDDAAIIQFEESPNLKGRNNYIFLDISVPTVLSIAEEDKETFSYSNFRKINTYVLKKRSVQQKRFFNNAAGLLVMGHWLEKELIEKQGVPKDKVHWVGAGSNLDISKIERKPKGNNKFLFVGKDFYRKNGDLVVEAFNILSESNKQYELYIIGPESLDEKYLRNPNIKFLGKLNRDELLEYYYSCDVFVMPSRFEAYGIAFVEALLFGLPVIGRNAYEMPYLVDDGKTGYLLRKQDPIELARLMEEAINNQEMKEEVIRRFDSYKDKYSWDAVAKRIKNTIENGSY